MCAADARSVGDSQVLVSFYYRARCAFILASHLVGGAFQLTGEALAMLVSDVLCTVRYCLRVFTCAQR